MLMKINLIARIDQINYNNKTNWLNKILLKIYKQMKNCLIYQTNNINKLKLIIDHELIRQKSLKNFKEIAVQIIKEGQFFNKRKMNKTIKCSRLNELKKNMQVL